jgi:predicted Fe-Mo cluster-binding NifX family protein
MEIEYPYAENDRGRVVRRMKAAFAVWNDRIAPVFDVARQVRLVDEKEGSMEHAENAHLPDAPPAAKAARLAEKGVGVLVCGAITQPLHAMITAHGIQVIPFIAGNIRDIIQAWLAGKLDDGSYAMPGCCGNVSRRRLGRGCLSNEEEGSRREGNRGGGHYCWQGRGRMGGPSAGSLSVFCMCPHCGYREPHERGVPCYQKPCPSCGAVMTRE